MNPYKAPEAETKENMKRCLTAVNVRLLRLPCWEYVYAWLSTVATHGDHIGHPWF